MKNFDTVLDSGLFHTIADPTEIGSSTIQDGDPARRPLLHAVSQRSAAGTPGLASDNAGRNQNQPPRCVVGRLDRARNIRLKDQSQLSAGLAGAHYTEAANSPDYRRLLCAFVLRSPKTEPVTALRPRVGFSIGSNGWRTGGIATDDCATSSQANVETR